MKRFVLFSLLSVFVSSCQLYNDADLVIDHTNGFLYNIGDMYEDEFGNKGIVASIYNYRAVNGDDHERIIVISLDENSLIWGQNDSNFEDHPSPEAYLYSISMIYTSIALENGIKNYPAFMWCYELNSRRKREVPELGDWLLPSVYDYNCISINFEILNTTLIQNGYSPLDDIYWAADNYSETDAIVWSFHNNQAYYAPKNSLHNTRAIRYIYIK